MPELPEPITENKFPDCIAMNLQLTTASQTRQFFSFLNRLNPSKDRPTLKSIDVDLTVNFSAEQQIKVPGGEHLGFRGGKVSFGVRQGKLQLDLKNCQLHMNEIILDRSFKILMEIETQKAGDQADQNGSSTSRREIGDTLEVKMIENAPGDPLPVKPQETEDTLAWNFIFKAKGAGPLLDNAMTETKLGRLQLMDPPCEIKATFRVRGEDIRLTWSKVGPSQNLDRNKIALIERALALRYISPQLESGSLSEVSWRYG